MPKLVPISPKHLVKILVGLGFSNIRISGSHHFFRNPDGRTTVIPIHGSEEISGGLLLKILRDIEISKDDFEQLR